MKIHTNNYKNEIKKAGKEIDVKTNYIGGTLTKHDIATFKPRFNCELFKTIMKSFEFDSDIKLDSKNWIIPQFGVKVGSSYEYLTYGSYYINKEAEYNADTKSYVHKAYDKMIESMIYYDESPLEITYPITYGNIINAIAIQLGWTFIQTGFPNEDTEIEYDLYSGLGLTYRDILDDLCPASMGNFIVKDDGELRIIYPTETSDTINEDFLNEENITIGKKVGPVNVLKLSRAEGGDVIYRNDTESITENGEYIIEIKDNLLLSSDFRENFIDEMFNKIKGFEYYTFDISSQGIGYFDPLDRFTLHIYDNDYSVVILNDEFNVEDGVEEKLYSPEMKEAVIDYSTSSQTDKAKKMATIIAYKNQARIELVSEQTDENTSKIGSLELTSESITQSVTNVQSNLNATNQEIANNQETTSTQIQQVSDAVNFRFINEILPLIQDGDNRSQEKLDRIERFIRFEMGHIILGEVGSNFSLEITNERIAFKQGDDAMAWFTNNELYINRAIIAKSLQVGETDRWAQEVDSVGNLNFGRVV